MKAWFTTYSSTNAMESLTKVFTVLVLIATTLPICLLNSAILPVLLLLGQLAVRCVSLGWQLNFSILSTENDELLVSFSFLSELACFVLPIFASFAGLSLFFLFLFHLTLRHYPGILLPAKSWLSNWNCGFSEQLLAWVTLWQSGWHWRSELLYIMICCC